MTKNIEQNYQPTTMTPGQLLRQAREARGWTISDVSGYTRLSVQCIRDIEEDHYEHIAAPVYLNGYLRSYSRAVGIAEERIFDSYRLHNPADSLEVDIETMVPVDEGLDDYDKPDGVSSKQIMRWGTLIIGLCLVTLVMLWWSDQSSTGSSAAVTPVVLSNSTTNNLLQPAAAGDHAVVTADQPQAVSAVKPQLSNNTASAVSHQAIVNKKVKKTVSSLAPTYTVIPSTKTKTGA